MSTVGFGALAPQTGTVVAEEAVTGVAMVTILITSVLARATGMPGGSTS
jgi:hypothetical protein